MPIHKLNVPFILFIEKITTFNYVNFRFIENVKTIPYKSCFTLLKKIKKIVGLPTFNSIL